MSYAAPDPDWEEFRATFPFEAGWVNFAGMSLSSHPRAISKAIDLHRQAIDAQPYLYVLDHFKDEATVADAAGRYFKWPGPLIATTGSTTMGIAQIYGGLRIKPGQEILTSRDEHFSTVDTLQGRRRRDGLPFRQVALYRDSAQVTEDEVISSLMAEIRPETRALALAWVYSCNGVKMPIARIRDLVRIENARRGPGEDPLLLCVDGVHGFGVEDETFEGLGCDLLVSGCHKWIFGPRGTGVIYGTESAWSQLVPLVPSFSRKNPSPGRLHSPGGVHAYEHVWALGQAFDFLTPKKAAAQARVRELTRLVKDALKTNPQRYRMRTPDSDSLSSGIVCFDVAGLSASDVFKKFKDPKVQIVLTASSWDATDVRDHVRLSISVLNNEGDIAKVLEALDAVRPT
jgi:isopenicillin-N epimerase